MIGRNLIISCTFVIKSDPAEGNAGKRKTRTIPKKRRRRKRRRKSPRRRKILQPDRVPMPSSRVNSARRSRNRRNRRPHRSPRVTMTRRKIAIRTLCWPTLTSQ